MTRRESHAKHGRAARIFSVSVAVACSIALAACDDGLEPERQMPTSSNVDAGGQREGTTTSSNPSSARDGGAGGGAPAMSGSSSGGAAMGTNGGAAMGGNGGTAMSGANGGAGAGSGADGGMQAPSVQVVAACMGHGGETVCDGASLIRCGMAGNAESTTPCMNEARCRAGLMTGKCGSCDPGAVKCSGVELQECNANGEFVMKMPCPSPELCSEMNKSCNPMQCGADSVKCENGFLQRCKPDLTGFDMGMKCMSQMLCSEPDKRCNECMPNTKVCEGDNVMSCSADGKGPTPMTCTGTTPRCLGGKCVQCKEDTDCMTTMDCRVGTCNKATGMCTTQNAPRGTKCASGFCDLLGGCSQCVEDTHCSSAEYCLLGACTARSPLIVSSLLGCSLTLNAGFGLYAETVNATGAAITATLTEFIIPTATLSANTSSGPRAAAFVPAVTSGPRTFSVGARWTDGMMSGTATCSAQQVTTSSATLTFSGGGGSLTATIAARK